MTKGDVQTVQVLKALADETRLEIVRMLCKEQLCGGEILERFDITQPTLSYHMRILVSSGLVAGRRNGAWICYSLNRDFFDAARKQLCRFCEQMNSIKDEAHTADR